MVDPILKPLDCWAFEVEGFLEGPNPKLQSTKLLWPVLEFWRRVCGSNQNAISRPQTLTSKPRKDMATQSLETAALQP